MAEDSFKNLIDIHFFSYYMSFLHFHLGSMPKSIAEFSSARTSWMPFRQPKLFLDILIHRQWDKVHIRVDTLGKL